MRTTCSFQRLFEDLLLDDSRRRHIVKTLASCRMIHILSAPLEPHSLSRHSIGVDVVSRTTIKLERAHRQLSQHEQTSEHADMQGREHEIENNTGESKMGKDG